MARSHEDVRRGLCAVVFAGENFAQASRDLAESGIKVTRKTLAEWAGKTHVEEFQRIKAEQGPKIRELAAEQQLAASKHFLSTALRMNEKLEGQIDEIPPRDLPGAVRNAMTSSGIAADKALSLKGEPTVIEHRSSADILRAIAVKVGPTETIDSTATEEPVATAIEPGNPEA